MSGLKTVLVLLPATLVLAVCGNGAKRDDVQPGVNPFPPPTWSTHGDGYSFRLQPELRIEGEGERGFALATAPLQQVRGKHMRISARLTTERVTGRASLWCYIGGVDGQLFWSGGEDAGFSGDTPWTAQHIDVTVPDDAVEFAYGALLEGGGSLAVADVELSELSSSVVEVEGSVVGVDGQPDTGGYVTATSKGAAWATAKTQVAGGRFSLQLPPGDYVLTAASAAGSAHVEVHVPIDAQPVVLNLDGAGHRVAGRVRYTAFESEPNEALVRLRAKGTGAASRIYHRPLHGDTFETRLPAGEYYASVEATGVRSPDHWFGSSAEPALVVRAYQEEDLAAGSPPELGEWLHKTAAPIRSVDPGGDNADLRPVATLVGDARVVGVGEATHGTREFATLKHRLFEYLVREKGFTAFAVEANWTESAVMNDYVVHGRGDPITALEGMHFSMLKTEAFLELIEWMRQYNQDPTHPNPLRFYGIDMQYSAAPLAAVLGYLGECGRAVPDELRAAIEPLADDKRAWGYRDLTDEQKTRTRDGIDALRELLRAHRHECEAATGKSKFRAAVDNLEVLSQSEIGLKGSIPDLAVVRDRFMAENVQRALDAEGPDGRVFVWAHNLHVAYGPWGGGIPSLGGHLRSRFDGGYRAIGFLFNRGTFFAEDRSHGKTISRGRIEFSLAAAPEATLEYGLSLSGYDAFLLNLRELPATGMASWLRAPHLYRYATATFEGDAQSFAPVVITDEFDAVIYLDDTTSARPLPPRGD